LELEPEPLAAVVLGLVDRVELFEVAYKGMPATVDPAASLV
jgi:hypothetical protein